MKEIHTTKIIEKGKTLKYNTVMPNWVDLDDDPFPFPKRQVPAQQWEQKRD